MELQYYATKADLAELKAELIKWMVGLRVVTVVAASSIASSIVPTVQERSA